FVSKVLRSGAAYQILKVIDTKSETVRVVKVISRSMIYDDKISSDIEYLLKRKQKEYSTSRLLADFQTTFDWFMVFAQPRITLRDVLESKKLMPLPARHVREITSQIISAAHSLHRRSMLHLDICPSMVELASFSTNVEYEYTSNSTFQLRLSLSCASGEPIQETDFTRRCTKIYLVFHGDAAIAGDRNIGTDQYRAPEVVLGWASKFRTDNFSIGCVMWELIKGHALFPPCEEERNYIKAKIHAFKAVLGYFPRQMRERAALTHEGLFKKSTGELQEPWDLSDGLKHFIDGAEEIEVAIRDIDIYHVVHALTRLSPRDRLPLCDVLTMPYFSERTY
ncbi:LOW QUALITY PROTEIN: hypothetical protein CVT26_014017, partial [Gymnopilus dilepis]